MEEAKVILFSLLAFFPCLTLCSDRVPVLMWSSDGSTSYETPLAGHTISQEEFGSSYLKKASSPDSKHNIVAFIQDQLSVDDLTQHGDVYNSNGQGGVLSHLKNEMDRHASTHLASVEQPSQAITTLQKSFPGRVHQVSNPDMVQGINVDDGERHFIVINLPRSESNADMRSTLSQADNVIGTVSEYLSSLKIPFTAFYTAKSSSKSQYEDLHKGRHLMAAESSEGDAQTDAPTEYTLFATPCVLLYANKVQLRVLRVNNTELDTPAVFDLDPFQKNITEPCDNSTTEVNVEYPPGKIGELTSFSLSFRFVLNNARREWFMPNITVTYAYNNESKGGRVEATETVMARGVSAPFKFSYSCKIPGGFGQRNKSDIDGASLVFEGLQTQYSDKAISKFGRPNDCVGFFSIPIWSGIFCSIILVAVLTFGITMIMGINTMDRFDDPKGKSISVNTSE